MNTKTHQEAFVAEYSKVLNLDAFDVKNGNIMSSCPNPDHKDQKPSFGFDLNTHFFNCWGCGLKGKGVPSLLVKIGKDPFDWNPDWDLKSLPDRKINSLFVEAPKKVIDQRLIKLTTQNNDLAIEKLSKRGIEPEVVKKFKIGYNPNRDILYFPIFNHSSELLGWVERSDLYPGRYKVMPEGVDKGTLLYGSSHIDRLSENNVYLVEGPVDCLKMWGWGFKSVASLGATLLKSQLNQLEDLAKIVLHIPDNDEAGNRYRKEVKNNLRDKFTLFSVYLPKNVKDVGECQEELVKYAIKRRERVRPRLGDRYEKSKN